MRHVAFSLVGLLGLAALGGCSESHPSLDTGLPSDQPIGNLSAEDAQKACEGVQRFANELVGPKRQVQLQCTIAGITAELGGFGSCAGVRDNCVDSGTIETDPIELSCDAAGPVFGPDCDATVGQVEACASDIGAAADAVLDGVSCGLVKDEAARNSLGADIEDALDPDSHASCASLSDACLAYLDLDVDTQAEPAR